MTAGAAPPSTAEGCGLTVLRASQGRRATKQWRWNATLHEWTRIDYQAGACFTAVEHQVRDLPELVEVIDAVRRDPTAFVVRGALAPWAREQIAHDPDHRIRRCKLPKNGIEPALVEVPRSWVMIDIDRWPLPSWADLVDDPGLAIDHAIHELLPPEFHDAECFWQLSSSAGFVPGILKAHLFFWLAEPATNLHLRAVLKQHAPGVDTAPLTAVQPHYIADPIISGGYDPLPRRTGWRKGEEAAVKLPELRPVVRQPRQPGTGTTGTAGGVLGALAVLGHGEGGRGFHEPLRTATLHYARDCNRSGERDDEAIKATLRDAIRNAPCRPGGNVERPYCQDWYLQPMIDGAFAYLAGNAEIRSMRPHHAAPTGTVDEARAAIREHVRGFLGRTLDWHRASAAQKGEAEHAALVVAVGGGKSSIAREELAGGSPLTIDEAGRVLGYINEAKAARIPHRVLWLVPTHKLGRETIAAMRALGLNAAPMLGRQAPDPDHPDFDDPEKPKEQKSPMCLNLPAVDDARAAGYEVEKAACGKPGAAICPFYDYCPYQRQKLAVAEADVIVTSHQSLFHELTKVAFDGVGLVIVDESWWRSGLHPNQDVNLASFAEEPTIYPVLYDKTQPRNLDGTARRRRKGDPRPQIVASESATADLHALCLKAQAAFEATPMGEPVSRQAAVAAGLTAEECDAAYKLEWRRKVEDAIWPGMAPEARQEGLKRAAGNLSIGRRGGVWKALAELLCGEETHTGRLSIGTRTSKAGAAKVILLHSRDEVRDEIAALPVLLLDATMPEEIVRHYLPRLKVLANVQAQTPHVEVVQVLGGWGKTSLVPNPKAGPNDAENRRRENLVGQLADFVRLHSGGDALAITYQAIEGRFCAPGVRVEHFNNVSGLDAYKDVRALAIVGRPHPDARELRDLALALMGKPIPLEESQVETRGALMADGTGAAINVRAYADPDLEALRAAITDGELVQDIGRGRGINRTAETPLKVFIFADVALPLAITRIVRWEDVRPDPLARMAARGRVLFNTADASKAYPDLFPNPKAAEYAFGRARAEDSLNSLCILDIGELGSPRLVEVAYKPTGKGQKERRAMVAPELLTDTPTWLAALVGPLAHYAEHVPEPPPPPPMAEKPPERPRPPPDATSASAPRTSLPTRPAATSWIAPRQELWDRSPPPRGSGAPAVEATWEGAGDD